MRFAVEYPIASAGYAPAFTQPDTMARFARGLEAAGVDVVMFSDHPAPSAKWLASGGHETFDPLTALAFCAAVTTRLQLMTCLLVLPYRNPLIAAKQVATVDVLSGGRLAVGVGAGYLRSEFAAVGVPFDARNELFDEALEVLAGLWAGPTFGYDGRAFSARDQVSRPGPVQLPHPPLWIGGNTRRAWERVVRHGAGWAPMIGDRAFAGSTRTAALDSLDALRTAVEDLRALAQAAGRDPVALGVQLHWADAGVVDGPVDQALAMLERLAAIGVTCVSLRPPVDDVERCLDLLAAYGEQVITPARGL